MSALETDTLRNEPKIQSVKLLTQKPAFNTVQLPNGPKIHSVKMLI